MKYVGFVTSSSYEYLTSDDQIVLNELNARGVKVKPIVWDRDSTKGLDALIVRSCWDYHRKFLDFNIWLESVSTIQIPIFNSIDALKWNLNKRYLFDLEERGVLIPLTTVVGVGASFDLDSWMDQNRLSTCVVKPVVSMSGDDTYRLERTQTKEFRKIVEGLGRDLLVQEFISEIQEPGEISLVYFNDKFSHAVRKTPKEGEFRVQQEHGGNLYALEVESEVAEVGLRILQAGPPLTLYARVDVVPTSKGFVLMELEIIDPSLFLSSEPKSAARFAEAVCARI